MEVFGTRIRCDNSSDPKWSPFLCFYIEHGKMALTASGPGSVMHPFFFNLIFVHFACHFLFGAPTNPPHHFIFRAVHPVSQIYIFLPHTYLFRQRISHENRHQQNIISPIAFAANGLEYPPPIKLSQSS